MKPIRPGCRNSHFSVAPFLLAAISGLCLVGCNGLTHLSPTILSPSPSASVSSLPVTIQIRLNWEPLSSIRIELNGAHIASDFTESNGIATATIKDGVYVGDNRLSATAINLPSVSSRFSYAPPMAPGLSASQPPDSVPIQTQVQTTNGSRQQTNGVEVGQTIYANPGPATDWQLLLLSRTNLSLAANKHYTLTPGEEGNYTALNQLIADTSPGGPLVNQCGQAGCLMILQGPVNNAGFRPYPCGNGTKSDATECSKLQSALTSIGATAISAFISSDTASEAGYSFIGNVGRSALSAGVNFERITCSNSNGCLKLPVPAPNESNSDFMNGIAPNGVDGVMPNLAGTADTGTTSFPATPNAPAMTINNNGAMSGLLVPDNNNNYTFTYAAPPVRFQMGPAPDDASKHILILQIPAASPVKFPGGQTTLQVESRKMPAGETGGFHLVILDATTLKVVINATYVTNPAYCPGSCQSQGTTIYSVDQLPVLLRLIPSRGNLWFLGSFGSLAHDFPATTTSPSYQMQDVWDRVAQSVQDLGGTYATFAMLDNPALAQNDYDQYSKDKVPTDDDYNMVGQLWINASGVPNPYAAEASKAISRQTSLYPVAGNMQGVLKKGHDGFYVASQHSQYAGVLPVPALDFYNASYLPRIPWPLTGPNDPVGPKNAYQWISEQLLQCTNGCGDIRSAYTNLNLSPNSWQFNLGKLHIPSDCTGTNNPCGFTSDDFTAARSQLLQEFNDLIELRGLQNNMVTTAVAEAPNFNSLLTAVGDNVLANIPYTDNIQIGANTTSDVLNLVGDASGIAAFVPVVGGGISGLVRTGIGLYELISDDGTTASDPNGISLMQQERDFAEIGALANQRANQYANSVASIGTAFNRIVSDWGRMQTAAMPVINNTLQFDDQALGQYLIGYNLTTRRSLYAALMPLNYYAVHYRYADPGLNHQSYGLQPDWYYNYPYFNVFPCQTYQGLPKLLTDNSGSFGLWEGALMDGPGASLHTSTGSNGHAYPFDAWWDVWFVGQKQAYDNTISQFGSLTSVPQCPANHPGTYLPSTSFFKQTELFTPIGTDANALGLYKPWFLGRGSLIRLRAVGTGTSFWDSASQHGKPSVSGSDWAPDPDNY